jgi:serine/threonine protein kinase
MNGLSDSAVRRLQEVANWPAFDAPRYTVLEEIGRGGMGTVYIAIDEPLGREVAIKVSNAVATAAVERRLRAEARILAQLEHPGIVPVHDVGTLADGRMFYVMKRVRGRTLLEHLRDVPDTGERLRIFERICETVAFAHARGVIHRDLKPDNVMVGPFGEVLVMDWGVAKALSTDADAAGEDPSARGPAGDARGHTDPGTVLGTRGFMAPEQAGGGRVAVDERADVYGLGAMLVTLLTGSAAPLAEAPADRRLDQEKGIPRALRAIAARALAADPADRYPSVNALAADVSRYRAGLAVEAHRETLVERAVRVARVYRVAILLVLAYIIMRAIVALTAGR